MKTGSGSNNLVQKSEKLKVKKAIEKGNMDGARIYAESTIRKRNEQLNYVALTQ